MATLNNETAGKASWLKLVIMGFLAFWMPFVFVWFIQKREYPTTYRRLLTAWAILWCSCAVLFFVVNAVTGDQPIR